MASLKAHWTHLASAPLLQRSSQCAVTANGCLYVFGGERLPREPVDNDIHVLELDQSKISTIAATAAPSPRVGAAATVLHDIMYVFSGRGGADMQSLDDHGVLWAFDTRTHEWRCLQPEIPQAPFPCPRSYHALTNDGDATLYLHAGCSTTGRLQDLWAFNVPSQCWARCTPAPSPARGGSSLAFVDGCLYRMHGFDGQTELGGQLDCYNPRVDEWTSKTFIADGKQGPEPRSVGALLPVNHHGRQHLIVLFGERDPSYQGHEAAGKMLQDVWTFDLKLQKWQRVEFTDSEQTPVARGWFAAAASSEALGGQVVVQGGLDQDNRRLDDVWMLKFE